MDGVGSHATTDRLIKKAREKNLKIETLTIVNLARRWEDKLAKNEFKSGASAMAAIEKARKLLASKKVDLVVIRGEDLLRTGYAPGEREKFMKLYDHEHTPLEGYNELVPLFLQKHKLSEEKFFEIRDLLFQNYARTWKKKLPDERWFRPLTKYFRGVDCANPNINYSGQIILSSKKTPGSVEIIGNAFVKLSVDGYESLPKIAPYLHLKRAITKAETEAKISFKKKFLTGSALLDAYTCYPVVPMGLIYRLGLVKKMEDIPALLEDHAVTVTGGLNLGKAPWNLTSLNALIVMREKLLASKKFHYGLVHGNGSLGNQQGITILRR